MNTIEVSTPTPACILPIDHPARAHVAACDTDIARTFELYADDYQREQIETAQCEDYENWSKA